MLFDLRGKRKRAVQATYLGLAVLIGVGLVGFGIGGQGGGFFSNNNGGGGGKNKGDKVIRTRIANAQTTLARDPKNEAALATLVHQHYLLAQTNGNTDPNASTFGPKAVPELQQTDAAWQRYFKVAKKPNSGVANTALQAESQLIALDPRKKTAYAAGGADAAEVLAAADPNPQRYSYLALFASTAGQTRKAQLAAQKALRLAPPAQRPGLKQQLAQYLKPPAATKPAPKR